MNLKDEKDKKKKKKKKEYEEDDNPGSIYIEIEPERGSDPYTVQCFSIER